MVAQRAMILGAPLAVSGFMHGAGWYAPAGRAPSEAHKGRITALAISEDGRLALSGSDDRTAKVWDLPNRKFIRSLDYVDSEAVESAAISPDGRMAATGTKDHAIAIWDLGAAGFAP
jgi:WD40 repeat protein